MSLALPGPFVVHGVQHVFHPPVIMKKWPGKDRRMRIVFITRDINEATLRDTLKLFVVQTPSERQEVAATSEAVPASAGE
jgi:G3E family GTPase